MRGMRGHRFGGSAVMALCSLALVAGGCGGGDGVSKAEYRGELAQISKDAGKAHHAVEQGASQSTSVAQVQTLLSRFAAAEDRIGDEVSKLKVPKDAKAANAELARGQHDDAAEIRALLPRLGKFKSPQEVFTYLSRLSSSKGGREGDDALTKLKQLGYTSGS